MGAAAIEGALRALSFALIAFAIWRVVAAAEGGQTVRVERVVACAHAAVDRVGPSGGAARRDRRRRDAGGP